MLIDLDFRPFELPGLAGVTVDVRPLQVGAYQDALRVLQPHQKEGGANAYAMMADGAFLDVAKRIFPEHVRNLSGIELRVNGETRAAKVEDLYSHGALFPTALGIMAHLLAISMLSETEAGNSNGPSASTSNSGIPGKKEAQA